MVDWVWAWDCLMISAIDWDWMGFVGVVVGCWVCVRDDGILIAGFIVDAMVVGATGAILAGASFVASARGACGGVSA